VGRNKVIGVQLPNWWPFNLLDLACSRLSAVLNPLMPIFRERELSFMLRHGEAKILVVPRQPGISIVKGWRKASNRSLPP
jgi:cyclohexanecarboxylate-CoA ligase